MELYHCAECKRPFVSEDHEAHCEICRVDNYGNPIDGSSFIYCSFPDCGCAETRLCMAERGFHSR